MKKTVISMLLVLALVLCFALVAAPTAQAVNTTHTDHCICGGTSNGVNGHSCATANDWQKWDDAEALPTETGKYWLATDVTLTSIHQMEAGADVVICLNGNKILGEITTGYEANNTEYKAAFCVKGNNLSICDCSKVETATGYTYSGIIQNTTTGQDGGVFFVDANGVLTVYGGNVVSPASKKGACALSMSSSGLINIYEGNFQGNTASTSGGCFHIEKADLNIYGGVISGGSSPKGGAIYMKGTGTNALAARLYIGGGIIKDCSATGNSGIGGAIYFDQKDSVVEIAGGKIENCSATGKGGAIYAHALRNTLTISGGEIIGCTAAEGDAIYGNVPSQNAYTNTYNFTGGKIVSGKNTGNVIAIYEFDSANNKVLSLGITKMGLEIAENGSVGVGYITSYTMTDGMKAKLTASADLNNTAYGLKLWTENGTPVYAGYNNKDAAAVRAYLANIMDGGNDDATSAATKVNGAAYAVIGGTVVESKTQDFTLQTLIEKMDTKLTDNASLEILADLYKLYQTAMESWNIPNIKAKAAA